MPVERGDDLFGMGAAERHHIGIGGFQIGRHAHFGHGHDRADQRFILDFTTRKNFCQRVAHQFAHAQHALARTQGLVVFFHASELGF
ncbi:hypothetical protein D3C87_1729800 [compost metagenome]